MDEYLEVAPGVQAADLQAFYKRLMSRCVGGVDEYLEVAPGVQAAELQAFYKRLMSR